MAARAAADAYVSLGKLSTAVADVAGAVVTSETVVGTVAFGTKAAYDTIGGLGQGTQAVVEAYGAISGNTSKAGEITEAIQASTTVGGVVGTLTHNGDTKIGAKWATYEQLGTSLIKGDTFKKLSNMLDTAMSLIDVAPRQVKQANTGGGDAF